MLPCVIGGTAGVTDGSARTERLLIRAFVYLRVVQLAVVVPAAIPGGMAALLSVNAGSMAFLPAVLWSAVLCVAILRSGEVKPLWIAADTVLAAAWLIAVPRGCVGVCGGGWETWVLPTAIGAGVLAAVFGSRAVAWSALALLVASWWIGRAADGRRDDIGLIATEVFLLIGFSLLARSLALWQRSLARELDRARGALEAHVDAAMAGARAAERARHYDRIHQGVLSTLNGIARGGMDFRADEVRRACAREADYLRCLLTGSGEQPADDLVAELARAVRDKQAFGLRVVSRMHDVPSDVPEDVRRALTGAVAEALNNVLAHAGTTEAWLSAYGEDGGLRISVADRGEGFVVPAVSSGRGLVRDLGQALRDVGATSKILSRPGHGCVVDIAWAP